MEFIEIVADTVPGDYLPEVLLMPVGDVQCGVAACDEDRFQRHMEYGIKRRALFLGMGDYVDMAAPSDRRRLRQADFYDTVTAAVLDKAEADVARFLRLTDGSRGQWAGLLQGHHYMAFPDGTTSDTRIAAALDAPFLGDCALVRVDLGKTDTHADILCHHGQGSTGSEAAALSVVMKFGAGFGHADVVVNGHHHKKVATKKPRPYSADDGKLVSKNTIYAVTGSFLKGYLQCSQRDGRAGGSYIEQRMLSPVALGGIIITLRARPGGRLDLDVSL